MEQASITNLGVNPISELKSVRSQIKALQEAEDRLKMQLNRLLDANGLEKLSINGYAVARVINDRSTLDTGSLKNLHPEIYEAFTVKKAVISLRVI